MLSKQADMYIEPISESRKYNSC